MATNSGTPPSWVQGHEPSPTEFFNIFAGKVDAENGQADNLLINGGTIAGTVVAGSGLHLAGTLGVDALAMPSLDLAAATIGGATQAEQAFIGGNFVWGLADAAGNLAVAIDANGRYHAVSGAFNMLSAGTGSFGYLTVDALASAALDIGDSVATTAAFMAGPFVWGIADGVGRIAVALDTAGRFNAANGVFTNFTAQNATITNFTIGTLAVAGMTASDPAWMAGCAYAVADPSGNVAFGVGNDGRFGIKTAVIDTLDSVQSVTNAGALRGLLQVSKRGPKRKIAIIGSSHEQTNANTSTGQQNLTMSGAITFLNVLARQAFTFDINNGFWDLGGSATQYIINNLPAIIAYAPDFLFTTCSPCNDTAGGLAQHEANMLNIYTQLAAAGITPVLMTGWPISSDNIEPVTLLERQKFILASDAWKRKFCEKYSFPLWDVGTPSRDLTASGGGFAPGMSGDELHPNYLAAYAGAMQGLKDLSAIIPPGTEALQKSAIDVFDPTWNPSGNIVPNGLFWTAGGTVTAPVTGTAPVEWSAYKAGTTLAGATTAVSLVTTADGIGQWFQLSISGTTTGGSTSEQVYFSLTILPGSNTYASGDVLETWMEVNVLANSPFGGVLLTLTDNNGTTSQSASCGNGGGNPALNAAWDGILYCPQITVQPYAGSGTQQITLGVQVTYDATVGDFSGTVQFRCPTIRKNTFTS